MTILLNTSKTMVAPPKPPLNCRKTAFLIEAVELNDNLRKLSKSQLIKLMHISDDLADKTHNLISHWSPTAKALALDSFAGDIYRGLQAESFGQEQRHYADTKLLILSGLYGGIRPLDGITPYRLELGYRLKDSGIANLYTFWGDKVAKLVPDGPIVNLASLEYSKLVAPYLDHSKIVGPRFLSTKKKSADFVTVHAKVARGAYARWMVVNQVEDIVRLTEFNLEGYVYNKQLSTPQQPTYIRPFN